jgi:hypothetical protein
MPDFLFELHGDIIAHRWAHFKLKALRTGTCEP